MVWRVWADLPLVWAVCGAEVSGQAAREGRSDRLGYPGPDKLHSQLQYYYIIIIIIIYYYNRFGENATIKNFSKNFLLKLLNHIFSMFTAKMEMVRQTNVSFT